MLQQCGDSHSCRDVPCSVNKDCGCSPLDTSMQRLLQNVILQDMLSGAATAVEPEARVALGTVLHRQRNWRHVCLIAGLSCRRCGTTPKNIRTCF
jgi:hypothetical protein